MTVDFDELLAALTPHGLAHEAPALAPFANFEIALAMSATASKTRIGGDPEVPPGFEWPCHRWPSSEVASWPDYAREEVASALAKGQVREEGDQLVLPLTFLMQVDLAEVQACCPTAALPATGRLLFFASVSTDVPETVVAKRVASAVRFVDGAGLAPVNPPLTPDSLLRAVYWLRPARRLHIGLPSFEDEAELLARLTTDAQRAFVRERCTLGHALLAARTDECAGPMPPPGEVALARVMEQVEVGLYVGDASWVTFVIPEADLAAGRWEAARASVFIG